MNPQNPHWLVYFTINELYDEGRDTVDANDVWYHLDCKMDIGPDMEEVLASIEALRSLVNLKTNAKGVITAFDDRPYWAQFPAE